MSALTSALDLHRTSFSAQLAENPEWAGRKIEDPNISNVFKRTFYQITSKFQVTSGKRPSGARWHCPSQYGIRGSPSSVLQNFANSRTEPGAS